MRVLNVEEVDLIPDFTPRHFVVDILHTFKLTSEIGRKVLHGIWLLKSSCSHAYRNFTSFIVIYRLWIALDKRKITLRQVMTCTERIQMTRCWSRRSE